MKSIMSTLKVSDDTPIENKMLTNIIESSQEKVEARNFGIRKNVLQYDDVMNKQREIIYGQRDQVLNGENVHDDIIKMLKDTIEENVSLYVNDHILRESWNLSSLKETYKWLVPDKDFLVFTGDELDKRVRESARFTGLKDKLLDKSPFDLSGGEKRRAAIAGVIAMGPDVLILDEPTRGIDVGAKQEILDKVCELSEQGMSVLVISSILEELVQTCDRIQVIKDGKTRGEIQYEGISEASIMQTIAKE